MVGDDVHISAKYKDAFYVKWNWNRIRHSCVLLNMSVLICLLCIGIGLLIQVGIFLPFGGMCYLLICSGFQIINCFWLCFSWIHMKLAVIYRGLLTILNPTWTEQRLPMGQWQKCRCIIKFPLLYIIYSELITSNIFLTWSAVQKLEDSAFQYTVPIFFRCQKGRNAIRLTCGGRGQSCTRYMFQASRTQTMMALVIWQVSWIELII